MTWVNVASGTLIILGAIMVVLGLFGGPHIPVIVIGVLAIIAAGVLGVAASRS